MTDAREAERYGRDPRVATRGGEAGPSPSFRTPYPRTYGAPERDRLRLGYWAYVQGHDRGWEAERKRKEAERFLALEREERRRRTPDGAPRGEGGGPTPSGLAAAAEDRPAAPDPTARFGVPVPDRLDFHRGPDVWRDRIDRDRTDRERTPGDGRPEGT